MTIAGAVLISAAVALTLTPMLGSKLLKARDRRSRLYEKTEPLFRALDRDYGSALERFLRKPALALLVLGIAGGVIITAYSFLPRELTPLEDRGRVWIRATAPEGMSYEHMQRFMDDIAAAAAERVPEARLTMTQVPSQVVAGRAGAVNNGHRAFVFARRERACAVPAGDRGGPARVRAAIHSRADQRHSGGEHRRAPRGVERRGVRPPGADARPASRGVAQVSRERARQPRVHVSWTATSSSAAPRCACASTATRRGRSA